jgi:hypothetical protein
MWNESHTCPPEWYAVRPYHDDEDNPEKTFGNDSEEAALKYAEDNFYNWEYPTDIVVWVKYSIDDAWEKFVIEVQSVPEFHARQIE